MSCLIRHRRGILKDAMEISLAVLADAANVSQEGKLNIFGIFNRIWTINFPAQHPQLQLVLGFEASISEADREKKIEIELRDADGRKIRGITGTFKVPKGAPGYPILANHILSLSGVTFPKEGDYAFHILLNGEDKKHVPIHVGTLVPNAGKKRKRK